MKSGQIHIYHGDGKGKTTCAMGLALRAAGRGCRIVVAQFLKSSNSGERRILEQIEAVTLLPLPEQIKFTFAMSEDEKRAEGVCCTQRLAQVSELARGENCRLVILDEVLDAVNCGLLPLEALLEFLDTRPHELDVVLTGRDPHPELMARAGYITEMKKHKHPYDQGLAARIGIEY